MWTYARFIMVKEASGDECIKHFRHRLVGDTEFNREV